MNSANHTTGVIPGARRRREPGIQSRDFGACSPGFRVRSLRSRPGMTAALNAALTRIDAGDGMRGKNKLRREDMP